jgi:hypothetical protein
VSNRLTVTIPGTPDRVLSQNARVHWGKRARATKQARLDAYWAVYQELGCYGVPFGPPLIISPTPRKGQWYVALRGWGISEYGPQTIEGVGLTPASAYRNALEGDSDG